MSFRKKNSWSFYQRGTSFIVILMKPTVILAKPSGFMVKIAKISGEKRLRKPWNNPNSRVCSANVLVVAFGPLPASQSFFFKGNNGEYLNSLIELSMKFTIHRSKMRTTEFIVLFTP